jgi:PAS domain S-box-containing protein
MKTPAQDFSVLPARAPQPADALRRAAAALAHPIHDELFAVLARELAALLDVALVVVAVFAEDSHDKLRTMAVSLDGRPRPNFGFSLEDLGCAPEPGHAHQLFPSGFHGRLGRGSLFARVRMDSLASFQLADSAGEPLGLLLAMDRRPLDHRPVEDLEATMSLFGTRACAEIERQRTEAALRAVALAVSAAGSGTVFDELVRLLATILHVDVAVVARHEPDQPDGLRVLALYCDGHVSRDFSYPLAGTPCGTVLGQHFRAYPRNLQARFPDDKELVELGCQGYAGHPLTALDGTSIGILSVASRRPLTQVGRLRATLKIFAVRAAAEVERLRASEAQKRAMEDLRQRESELQRSEEQYRTIFNASIDAMVLRDAQFRIVDVNATYEAMTGYSRSDVIGADRVVANPEQAGAAIRRLHERALNGETVLLDTQLVRRDGHRYELELRGVPILHRGQPHVLYVGRDVTQRVAAEQRRAELERQLRQAQKMEAIGQLTGGLAHDFNNILTSVLGYIGMGQERAATAADPQLARQLEQARLSAERAREHVAQLLSFSRPRRGERKLLDPAQIAAEVLQLLRPNLPTSIAVDCNPDSVAALPPVVADPVQFEQVLLNLCLNARDAIGEHGTIQVHTGHAVAAGHCASCSARLGAGRWVFFEVTDDGVGMSREVIDRMFEPFFTTKDVGRGTGMGLAMVHGIVHDHGGHLQVRSAPGRGSTFRVLLPAGEQDAADAQQPVAPPAPRIAAPLRGRVLLVEDEPTVSAFMQELLSGWGLEVVLERDPLSAARRLATPGELFSLLLTDQTMPGMTGLALARHAARHRPGLPVLLYTGNASDIGERELSDCGVAGLLRKPIDSAVLRSLLRDVLAGDAHPIAAHADCSRAHGVTTVQ